MTVYDICTYLYLCRNDSRIDRLSRRQLDSKAHIDYLIDPNAMGMRKQRTNIDRDRYTIDTIHGTFCKFASLDHRIVTPNTPYKVHHRACNVLDTKYRRAGQLL